MLRCRRSASTLPFNGGIDIATVVLTAREREVAAAVARGRTNRGIAMELGVSARTVEHHVSAIFAKLEIRSRHEIIVAVFAGRIDGVVAGRHVPERVALDRPPQQRPRSGDARERGSAARSRRRRREDGAGIGLERSSRGALAAISDGRGPTSTVKVPRTSRQPRTASCQRACGPSANVTRRVAPGPSASGSRRAARAAVRSQPLGRRGRARRRRRSRTGSVTLRCGRRFCCVVEFEGEQAVRDGRTGA